MRDAFVAVDVETANPNLSSICQIGVVQFSGDNIERTWETLVNPEDYFDPVHINIHGIDETAVEKAPTFPEVARELNEILAEQIVVSHMPFDKTALSRVCQKYRLPEFSCTWLDSARVSRRAWEQFAWRGYGLANVASWCGIEFKHHDALEDARVAGLILRRAIKDSGIGLREWLEEVECRLTASKSEKARSTVKRKGDPEGPLAGEKVTFTGALSVPRGVAADLAAAAGCDVGTSVGKKTTILVVGDQDLQKLAGHTKSSKHRKAEELIGKGQPIRILGETDFRTLIGED